MDIADRVTRVESLIARARRVPLTGHVLVNAEAAYQAVDHLRDALGDDPEAPTRYLSEIAAALDDLRADHRRSPLAAASAERVESIVDEAERAAARIEDEARERAERMTAEAEQECERMRAQAAADSASWLAKVEQVTTDILHRADGAQAELGGLFETVRRGGESVISDVQAMASELVEVSVGSSADDDDADAGHWPESEAVEPVTVEYGAFAVEPAASEPAEGEPRPAQAW